MSALTDAMRKKFGSPKEAIKALGLDEKLLALDSAEAAVTKPTQFASTAALLVGAAVRPMLKAKAKIDLMPVFKDLTADGFDAKEFQGALDAALKGKLAKDADPKYLADVMHHLDGLSKGSDESVSEEQHNAMEAAAHGNSTLGIPEKVGKEFTDKDAGKDKRADDNLFMKKAMDWMKSKGMDTAEFESAMGGGMDSEEEEAEEVTEGNENVEQRAEDRPARDKRMGRDKRADDKRADDKRADDRRADDGDASHAMDEASIEKRVTERLKSKFDAARDVKPWVGEVDPMAFDSGEAIYRHALKARGHKRWNTAHAEALRDLLDTYPKQGMRPVERSADPKYAMDESRRSDAIKLAPGLANIRIGV